MEIFTVKLNDNNNTKDRILKINDNSQIQTCSAQVVRNNSNYYLDP